MRTQLLSFLQGSVNRSVVLVTSYLYAHQVGLPDIGSGRHRISF